MLHSVEARVQLSLSVEQVGDAVRLLLALRANDLLRLSRDSERRALVEARRRRGRLASFLRGSPLHVRQLRCCRSVRSILVLVELHISRHQGIRRASDRLDGVVQIELEDFYGLGGLADLHERPDVNEVLIKLHHVVRAVHVDEELLALELDVLVHGRVVAEGRLAAAKVAAEHEELVAGQRLGIQRVQEAAINGGFAAHLIARRDGDPEVFIDGGGARHVACADVRVVAVKVFHDLVLRLLRAHYNVRLLATAGRRVRLDGLLGPRLVDGVPVAPSIATLVAIILSQVQLLEVKHLDLADVSCAAQLVQVAAAHDDKTRSARALV